jgi:hypothetical protein
MLSSPAIAAAQFLLGLPARFSNPLDRLLERAQATPLCVIAVAGPESGEVMTGLWNRGYDRVEAARHATCPSADQLADILLVCGHNRAIDAARCLHGMKAMLRDQGQAVIDAGHMTDPDERLRLCGLIAEEGFTCQPEAHLGAEIVARKLPKVRWDLAA